MVQKVFYTSEAKHGEKMALKEIFDGYYYSLCIYAHGFIAEDDLVDDIVQEAFIQLWQYWGKFENRVAIKSFLYLCVRNACFNRLKHKQVKYRNEKNITDYLFIQEEDEEVRMYEEELHARLYEAILKLPRQSRQVIMGALDGLDNTEISRRMNISLNSVKTLKKRAYQMLRDELGEFKWIVVLFLLFE